MWIRGYLVVAVCSLVSATGKEHIKQVLLKKCSGRDYSLLCFKLDLLRVLTQLGNSTRFYLAPGVTLVGTDETTEFSEALDAAIGKPKTKDQFDAFLMEAASKYVGTLNLTLQLKDSSLLREIQGFTGDVWTGRGRKAGLYALGTMAAVGFALLAALSGKALMASMLALMMSGLVSLRAGGGGGGGGNFGMPSGRITQYEIISKPASYATAPAYHLDHEHHHSAYTAPYAYARKHTDPVEEERNSTHF